MRWARARERRVPSATHQGLRLVLETLCEARRWISLKLRGGSLPSSLHRNVYDGSWRVRCGYFTATSAPGMSDQGPLQKATCTAHSRVTRASRYAAQRSDLGSSRRLARACTAP